MKSSWAALAEPQTGTANQAISLQRQQAFQGAAPTDHWVSLKTLSCCQPCQALLGAPEACS